VFIFLSIVTPNDLLCQIVNSFGVFYKNVGILLGVCLTVKNQVGVTHRGDGVDILI